MWPSSSPVMSGGGSIVPGWMEPSGRIASPPLPNRRGALVDLIQPRWSIVAEEHRVGLVEEPGCCSGPAGRGVSQGNRSLSGHRLLGPAPARVPASSARSASGTMWNSSATAHPVWVPEAWSAQRLHVAEATSSASAVVPRDHFRFSEEARSLCEQVGAVGEERICPGSPNPSSPPRGVREEHQGRASLRTALSCPVAHGRRLELPANRPRPPC